jgi:hypothetical protein
MKFRLIGAGVVLGLALGNVAVAAESTDADTTSGTTDSTVMTQATNPKADKQQKVETAKGGRPQNGNAQKQSD